MKLGKLHINTYWEKEPDKDTLRKTARISTLQGGLDELEYMAERCTRDVFRFAREEKPDVDYDQVYVTLYRRRFG